MTLRPPPAAGLPEVSHPAVFSHRHEVGRTAAASNADGRQGRPKKTVESTRCPVCDRSSARDGRGQSSPAGLPSKPAPQRADPRASRAAAERARASGTPTSLGLDTPDRNTRTRVPARVRACGRQTPLHLPEPGDFPTPAQHPRGVLCPHESPAELRVSRLLPQAARTGLLATTLRNSQGRQDPPPPRSGLHRGFRHSNNALFWA